MSDETKDGGILELEEIVDVPLRLRIGDTVRDVRLLDNEGLVALVKEVKERMVRKEAMEAKTTEQIEAVRRKFDRFDMNVDQIAQYCFTLEGSHHVLGFAMQRSGYSDRESSSACVALRRQLGAQMFASLAGDVSGIFPARKAEKPKEGGPPNGENPTGTPTAGQTSSP